jgi:hypothetical protein
MVSAACHRISTDAELPTHLDVEQVLGPIVLSPGQEAHTPAMSIPLSAGDPVAITYSTPRTIIRVVMRYRDVFGQNQIDDRIFELWSEGRFRPVSAN